ncbi:CoA-binding protein [uncultured Paludibaculum sp.]|uniref:CoA-binding protein n=1 Tax=uncultured Paludibaculum sp. TaxID=1765020 RepID=UPI002AAB5DAC|nr:CoA-binding protein [uncultured Paludibaculum sp.]
MPPELEILKTCKTIAVVGLSSNKFRPSYEVASYMQQAGYRIIPINPNETEILGEKAYPTLDESNQVVDLVNLFRRPEAVPEAVEAAIRIGAKAVWMQLDVVHEEAAQRARDAGLLVVQNRCLLIEHRRFRIELGA